MSFLVDSEYTRSKSELPRPDFGGRLDGMVGLFVIQGLAVRRRIWAAESSQLRLPGPHGPIAKSCGYGLGDYPFGAISPNVCLWGKIVRWQG